MCTDSQVRGPRRCNKPTNPQHIHFATIYTLLFCEIPFSTLQNSVYVYIVRLFAHVSEVVCSAHIYYIIKKGRTSTASIHCCEGVEARFSPVPWLPKQPHIADAQQKNGKHNTIIAQAMLNQRMPHLYIFWPRMPKPTNPTLHSLAGVLNKAFRRDRSKRPSTTHLPPSSPSPSPNALFKFNARPHSAIHIHSHTYMHAHDGYRWRAVEIRRR